METDKWTDDDTHVLACLRVSGPLPSVVAALLTVFFGHAAAVQPSSRLWRFLSSAQCVAPQ
jgi:hypothetical protein